MWSDTQNDTQSDLYDPIMMEGEEETEGGEDWGDESEEEGDMPPGFTEDEEEEENPM